MRFTPQFLDEIRARLPVSQVVARKVALKKKGRELAGLSPFKSEKTPSFFVNDHKGFYHCFASGEHGDIFTFVIKTEGLSFPEAVERLAQEAGVPVPQQRPSDPERADQRQRLLQLMRDADAFFRAQLFSAAATHARQYLEGRHIDGETIATFGLGFAPHGRSILQDHLADKGHTVPDMIASGMVIGGPDITKPYDRFRNRIMFPIHDAKGQVIAFGGRALAGDQSAKYLNSPETPLFHKGRQLYNLHRARQPAFDRTEIIAVEGYIDAIALARAGYMHTVAPLGTALTADQLQLMWRLAPEPILCFDGDAAGYKAAHRALDTALAILKPGFSLRFAFLADGLDPDDLVRQHGPQAVRSVLDTSRPLADVLWQREWDAGNWSTPERRAGLESRLRRLIGQIEDPDVRSHYGRALRERLENAWGSSNRVAASRSARPHRNGHRNDRAFAAPRRQSAGTFRAQSNAANPAPRTTSLKASKLVAGANQAVSNREAILLLTLLNHPWMIERHAEDIADIHLSAAAFERLRTGLLDLLAGELNLDSAPIRDQLEKLRLGQDVELVDRLVTHKSDGFANPDADSAEVEKGWRHTLAMHKRQGLQDQLAAAEREFRTIGDDEAMVRIAELQRMIASSWASEEFED